MFYLGINGGFGGGYQDASACFLADGQIQFAAEEERFSRIKYSPGVLPHFSIREGLKYLQISPADVKTIALHGIMWPGDSDKKISEYLYHNFKIKGKIKKYHHHNCHAASTFYSSGFKDALVISMDSSGDGLSTQISKWNRSGYVVLDSYKRPQSFGFFYSLITQFCGFSRDADEYKLMGLSSYAKKKVKNDLSFLLNFSKGKYTINEKYLKGFQEGKPSPSKQELLFNQEFVKKIGFQSRNPNSELSANYVQLAADAQRQLEKTVVGLIKFWTKKTGISNICLAGGVALNCELNRVIENKIKLTGFYIPPYCGDQGVSVGAAYLASMHDGIIPQQQTSSYLGKAYSNVEIKEALVKSRVKFMEVVNKHEFGAKLLSEGKIIGWFQGRSEIGPRALGNRSIIANPAFPNIKDRINSSIKFRESFRPFCPAVLKEDFSNYFIAKGKQYPYMNINVRARSKTKKEFSEIVHVDNTSRVQTVSPQDNNEFYKLLLQVKKITGHGLLINTSFNVRNHPIVETPYNALECFYSSGLDALIMGDFVVEK